MHVQSRHDYFLVVKQSLQNNHPKLSYIDQSTSKTLLFNECSKPHCKKVRSTLLMEAKIFRTSKDLSTKFPNDNKYQPHMFQKAYCPMIHKDL